jgi:hypothetical protein
MAFTNDKIVPTTSMARRAVLRDFVASVFIRIGIALLGRETEFAGARGRPLQRFMQEEWTGCYDALKITNPAVALRFALTRPYDALALNKVSGRVNRKDRAARRSDAAIATQPFR